MSEELTHPELSDFYHVQTDGTVASVHEFLLMLLT